MFLVKEICPTRSLPSALPSPLFPRFPRLGKTVSSKQRKRMGDVGETKTGSGPERSRLGLVQRTPIHLKHLLAQPCNGVLWLGKQRQEEVRNSVFSFTIINTLTITIFRAFSAYRCPLHPRESDKQTSTCRRRNKQINKQTKIRREKPRGETQPFSFIFPLDGLWEQ